MLILRGISPQESSGMPGSPSRLGLAHMPGEQMPSRPEQVKLSTTNLYIKGLPPDTTDHSLKEMCKGHGNILSTKAVLDPQTNQCKGFGFVDFDTAECAKAALESLRQQGYQVGMAKKQEQADTNVFFKNLPENMTKEGLEEMVKKYGAVSSVHIMKQNGRSQGVGFARMACKADCERVIQQFNNTRLPGRSEPLLVKFADLPNRQKNTARLLNGHDLHGTMALAPPTPYLFHGPPPQGALPLGGPAMYPETSMSAMTMAGMAPHQMQLQAVMAMSNGLPTAYAHSAQYPTLTTSAAAAAAAANYGYLGMAPAPAPSPASYHHHQTLQTQYGGAELQLQAAPTAASPGQAFYLSSASMSQMMPGMQATMDPSGMTPWQ